MSVDGLGDRIGGFTVREMPHTVKQNAAVAACEVTLHVC
jgi:hypothetical protein